MEKALPVKRVRLDKIFPNDWNPNKMTEDMFAKVSAGIERLINKGKEPPPITVRKSGKRYQIIDGEHRWKIFKDLKEASIPCWILDVSDADARLLTGALNYLRGEPEKEQYAEMILQVAQSGVSIETIAAYLPEDEISIVDMLEMAGRDVDLDTILAEYQQEEEDDNSEVGFDGESARNPDEGFVSLRYRVPISVAEIVQAELLRIKGYLEGTGAHKGLDFRSLEVMAVNSALTPFDQFEGEPEDPLEPVKAKRKRKKKSIEV